MTHLTLDGDLTMSKSAEMKMQRRDRFSPVPLSASTGWEMKPVSPCQVDTWPPQCISPCLPSFWTAVEPEQHSYSFQEGSGCVSSHTRWHKQSKKGRCYGHSLVWCSWGNTSSHLSSYEGLETEITLLNARYPRSGFLDWEPAAPLYPSALVSPCKCL